jgi:hypothetical protein
MASWNAATTTAGHVTVEGLRAKQQLLRSDRWLTSTLTTHQIARPRLRSR